MLRLILLLSVLTNIQPIPVHELSYDDWNCLVEDVEKSSKVPGHEKDYYEVFTLKPINVKMDREDKFKIHKSNKDDETKLIEDRKEKEVWENVKSFLTNDLKNFFTNAADNYNPIPKITTFSDDVKRSNSWRDIRSFFTDSYDQLAKMAQNIKNNVKGYFNTNPSQ